VGAAITKKMVKNVDACALGQLASCWSMQFYQDFTGQLNSPQPTTVSVSPGQRTALLHMAMGGGDNEDIKPFYGLSNYSYFSESAFNMSSSDWKQRYWGQDHYNKLLAVKRAWDPDNVFWCRRCVGSDLQA